VAAAYPDDPDYFDQEDLQVLFGAATQWMGLGGSWLCLPEPSHAQHESWINRAERYIEGSEANHDYYESLDDGGAK